MHRDKQRRGVKNGPAVHCEAVGELSMYDSEVRSAQEARIGKTALPGQAQCHQVYIGSDLIKLGFHSGWTNLNESPLQAYLPDTEAAFGGLNVSFSLASPWEP